MAVVCGGDLLIFFQIKWCNLDYNEIVITGIDDEGDIRKDCIFYTPEHEVSGLGVSSSVSGTFTDLFPPLNFFLIFCVRKYPTSIN